MNLSNLLLIYINIQWEHVLVEKINLKIKYKIIIYQKNLTLKKQKMLKNMSIN